MKLFRTDHQAIKLFWLVFFVYTLSWLCFYFSGINRTLLPSEDALPATYLPVSLVSEGNLDLNEYYDYLVSHYPNPDDKDALPFYVRYINDRYVSGFPVVNVLMVAPIYAFFIWGASLFSGLMPSLADLTSSVVFILALGKIASAIIAAFSVLVVYLIGKEMSTSKVALVVSLIYGLATSTFSVSSQGMWQHGSVELFLSLALLFLVRGGSKAYLSALFLSLATLTRPTMGLVAIIFAVYFIWQHQEQLHRFILLALLPLVPWFIYNRIYFGAFLSHAYNTGVGTQGNWTGSFPEGFLGLLLSPSKGLFIYSPVLLFVWWGIGLLFKQRIQPKRLLNFYYFALFAVVAYILLMGRWYHWFGGWSFSYRMIVDILPLIVLFLVPVMAHQLLFWWRFLFSLLFIYSFGIQLLGVAFFDGEWHARYDDGPYDTRWLWSIENSELLYYSRKIKCKLGTSSVSEYLECQGFRKESAN